MLYMHTKVLLSASPDPERRPLCCDRWFGVKYCIALTFSFFSPRVVLFEILQCSASYCGDLGGVLRSLLGAFPVWGGGEDHRPACLRTSRWPRPGVAVPVGLEGYVSLPLGSLRSPGLASGHFLSSPAGAALAGLTSFWGCSVGPSLILWQISA